MNYSNTPAQYGSVVPEKTPFIRGQRRRMNIVPMILGLFIPSAIFTAVYTVSAFSIRYTHPGLCLTVLVAGFLAVLICAYYTFQVRFRKPSAEREPSWFLFMLLTMAIAWFAGYTLGNMTYVQYMRPYYDMQNLHSYTDIYTDRVRGQQIMDAGSILFTEGSHVDVKHSMGFKNSKIYCVAPVISSEINATMSTYDFWVVGKDCCSGFMADFHCEGFNDPYSRGGLRLMSDDDRAFYRLAVQQAEATYNIKAAHPLFFEWVRDPNLSLEEWKDLGWQSFFVAVFSYFAAQAFFVVVAAIGFSAM